MNRYKIVFFIAIAAFIVGCYEEGEMSPDWEDIEPKTIMMYLHENEEDYSSFIKIVEAGGVAQAIGAYNTDGIGYTLFLPNNETIDALIASYDEYETLEDMLNDVDFINVLSRIHVLNMPIKTNDFPFGAFPEPTLSGHYLTVNYQLEEDTNYIKINNYAIVNNDVKKRNIELSNGLIHIIDSALIPITFNTYDWLKANDEYSIFLDAINLTESNNLIDYDINTFENREAVTLLVEADSIFNKQNIFTIDDLIQKVSPDDDDYTNTSNSLNRFVAYHLLIGDYFIDDFVDQNQLYYTHADVSLNINGLGLDVKINDGKQVFDTLINDADTILIDEILFKYDQSNIITESGSIHFIDQVMELKKPAPRNVTFWINSDPGFNQLEKETGSFLLDDSYNLETIEWSGVDLYFVSQPWVYGLAGQHYLEMDGDFSLTFTVPEVIRGSYTMSITAETSSQEHAAIEVLLDGKKVGGIIDLASLRSGWAPFKNVELGAVDITTYTSHVIEIRSLIPGTFRFGNVKFKIE